MREKRHYWEEDEYDTQDFDERFGNGRGEGTFLGNTTPEGVSIVDDYMDTRVAGSRWGCGRARIGKGDYSGSGLGDG